MSPPPRSSVPLPNDTHARNSGHLKRLTRESYRGHATVHWTMAIDHRSNGWLNPQIHLRLREILLHTLYRFRLVCPIYCLMPDHLHLIWMGTALDSDQLLAAKFFRVHSNRVLSPIRWQAEAYDHVLREDERQRDSFAKICAYVRLNPERAGLVKKGVKYPYSGAAIGGYPYLEPSAANYWDIFWNVFGSLVRK